MTRRSPRTAFILSLLLLSLATWSHAEETILLNGEDDWAPYCSASSDYSRVIGLAPDIVRAAFKSQGIQAIIRPVPFARCLYEVEKGKALGCFNTIISSETKRKYLFHSIPLFKAEMVVYGPASETKKRITIQDLEFKKVGTTNGYTYPTEFIENRKIIHSASPTEKSQLEKLSSGRIDYAVLWGVTGTHILKNNPHLAKKIRPLGVLSKDGLYIGFSKKHKDSQKFARALEKGLLEIQKNGSYQKILKQFYQQQPQP